MILKDIQDENFQDYKKVSMFLATCFCNWKCCKEQGISENVCQNSDLAKQPNFIIENRDIIKRYLNNSISESVVIGGLEPFMEFQDMLNFITEFRKYSDDDIVIYTGYNENEIEKEVEKLKEFPNIIIKFGRFLFNNEKKFDDVLGITLASCNQYAKKIS